MHDGAQQRLVALLLAVRLAQAQSAAGIPPTTTAGLERMAAELQLAVDELRRIAHGIHPSVLTDEGLAAAIDCLADATPLDVGRIPVERFSEAVENAAYRVVAEAATTGATRVVAEHSDETLVLDVTTVSRPAAMVELEDRIGAVNGSIRVEPAGGDAVRLHAEIPCA